MPVTQTTKYVAQGQEHATLAEAEKTDARAIARAHLLANSAVIVAGNVDAFLDEVEAWGVAVNGIGDTLYRLEAAAAAFAAQ